MSPGFRKTAVILAAILGIYLIIQYLFPLILPFLLGALLAIAGEPMVKFFCEKLHFPRGLAAVAGVLITFALLAMVMVVLCGLMVRQMQTLAGVLPDMVETMRGGMASLSSWLLNLTGRAPEALREPLAQNVEHFFSNGSALLERATGYLLRLASGILSQLPNGALAFGTGLISSFMISAKLPQIRRSIARRIPGEKLQPWLNSLKSVKTVILGWLKAQVKLSGVTFGILTLFFLLMKIPHAPFWALLVALVDAFPILGTGTALVPWSLISFLQGNTLRAFGLLGAYGVVTVTRSILEPRLVGRQLGLDPLVTLVCLYAGFRLWGLPGMILVPMLTVITVQLVGDRKNL